MSKKFIVSCAAIKMDVKVKHSLLSSKGNVSGQLSHLTKEVTGGDEESLEDMQMRMEGWYGSQKCPVSDGWRNHSVLVTEVD
jgi:hypothetical protein